MPVYKDAKTNTWYVKLYYTDYTGARKQKMKRGFALQRDAKDWERHFLEVQQGTPDMTFQALYELYTADLTIHARESTCRSQFCAIRRHLLPFWKDKKLNEITPADVRSWQGEIKKSSLSEYSQYAVNNYLSSMFNFAVKYYNLPANPCRMVKTIGKIHRSLNFWTLEEFKRFLPTVQEPMLRAAFLVLFYTGIRCGELLALTVKDFDPKEKTITVRGTFHRFNKIDTITEPKTDNSNRTITVPPFLAEEISAAISRIYAPEPDERIFQTVTSSRLYTAIQKGTESAQTKRIRVHDLRHSHVALLIDMDFPPILIAERIGDTVDMVNRVYGHLYPNRHKEVADQLEKLKL